MQEDERLSSLIGGVYDADTRFYRERAKPQGLVDFVSAVLDRSTTRVAMFGMFRQSAMASRARRRAAASDSSFPMCAAPC
jgi:hypothetical protein